MENFFPFIFLSGLAVAAVGMLALVVAAFRQKVWWGVGVLLFPPVALVFAARHPKKAGVPLGLLLLGCLAVAAPAAVNALRPIDLGPRERLVDGERHLTLTGWDRSDYSVLRLKPDVVVLQMANPDVSDGTLALLAGMSRLKELDLNGSAVTDAGLKVLRGLPSLESLRLRDTKVSDAGFHESLSPIETLKQLDLRGTAVTREAVQAWKDAKPGRRAMK
jgi:hypothetical protein